MRRALLLVGALGCSSSYDVVVENRGQLCVLGLPNTADLDADDALAHAVAAGFGHAAPDTNPLIAGERLAITVRVYSCGASEAFATCVVSPTRTGIAVESKIAWDSSTCSATREAHYDIALCVSKPMAAGEHVVMFDGDASPIQISGSAACLEKR